MKRSALIVSAPLIVGFAAGFWMAISIFAVDIDLLAVPYSNTAVVAQKSVVVENGKIRINIPQGTKLTYQYDVKGQPYYALQIVGEPFTDMPFVKTDNIDYFWVQNRESK